MLSPEQEAEARAEGWKFAGGFVARAFDRSGSCPFYNLTDLIKFLSSPTFAGTWRGDVYLSIPWSGADDTMALSEGWKLAYTDVQTLRPHIFPEDEAARDFVKQKAEEQSPLHLKAVKTLAKRRLLSGE